MNHCQTCGTQDNLHPQWCALIQKLQKRVTELEASSPAVLAERCRTLQNKLAESYANLGKVLTGDVDPEIKKFIESDEFKAIAEAFR